MDGERVGPLSYDVHPPEGETSAQRAIVIGAVAVVGLVTLSLVGGWFLLGMVESAAIVDNGGPLLILVVPVVLAVLASRESTRRTRRNAVVVVVTLSLFSAFFTNKMLGNVKPALPQIRRVLDSIDLPPGFRLVEEEEYGDRLCRRGCPTIERRYVAPATDPDPVSTLILAMFDQGWDQVADVDPRQATGAQKDGLTAQLGENDPHVVEMRVTRR